MGDAKCSGLVVNFEVRSCFCNLNDLDQRELTSVDEGCARF